MESYNGVVLVVLARIERKLDRIVALSSASVQEGGDCGPS